VRISLRIPVAMLNEQLLKAGFAYLWIIPANVKHVDSFRKAVSVF